MSDLLFQHFLKHRKVTTDSRRIERHAIYFALKGERFNGNHYAVQALEEGCDFAVIDEDVNSDHPGLVRVENALEELQELAGMYRRSLSIPFLAITGSNGKTTTKELITAVLSGKYKVHATHGNLNNHIGVPLTLLSIPADATFAVIEMGANHRHEIESYCIYASPDYGLITNIGKAHLEGFGGIEGVRKGKKELYDFVHANGGKVFVNVELEALREISRGMHIIPYGFGQEGAKLKVISEEPYLYFECETEGNVWTVKSHLTGAYNLYNFASAIAVGRYFGVPMQDQVAAMEAYIPDNNRSQVVDSGRNRIIMDAYNANPSSMEHALINLSRQRGEKYFVIGDMRELGTEGPDEHRKILKLASGLGLKGVIIGSVFSSLADETEYPAFENNGDAMPFLKEMNLMDHTVLIKGSRGIRLEELKDIF